MRQDPSIPALGSLEAKIMQVQWDRPGEYLSVRETRLLLDGDPAYTTVMTVMGRLYEKGLLRRRRDGRAWVYRPAMTREAYAAVTMSDALRVASDPRAALLHFVADLRPEEADALRRVLGPQ
jgi:predicted transcriptional regulator